MGLLSVSVAAGALLALVPSHIQPQAHRVVQSRRAVQPSCVATTEEDKALLDASKKVTTIAKTFGDLQGKQAQAWVEKAISGGDASTAGLMEMKLALFEECSLDDESGKCKALTEAVEALTTAVDDRRNKPKTEGIEWTFGATPIQEAATQLREAAELFGPEQKEAANEWIKKITQGKVQGWEQVMLLDEQVVLFGECVLSEKGTPSNCQQLEKALEEFQSAIEVCGIESTSCSPDEVASELKEEPGAAAPVTGRKRRAVKNFFKKLFGGEGDVENV